MLINNQIKNDDADDDGVYIYQFFSLKVPFICFCTDDYMIMVNLKYA
jgi:hypothetical protein